MSLQKYILGARLTYRDRGLEVLAGPTAMRRAFDADGKIIGEWQDCNAMTVCDASEVDAELARLREDNERLQRAVDWMRSQLVFQETPKGFHWAYNAKKNIMSPVPPELAAIIIKPREAQS